MLNMEDILAEGEYCKIPGISDQPARIRVTDKLDRHMAAG